MVDLPQHAGQVSIGLNWDDPALQYQEHYRRGPLSPMVTGMTAAFLLAQVVSVELAFKVVIALSVLGIPFAMRVLLRELGGHPWWVFLSFPAGFGFAFSFGFVNFCLAVPLVLLLFVLTIRYSARPTLTGGIGLFAMVLLVFATHAIAFGFGGLVAGLIVLARAPSLSAGLRRTAPLLLALPIALYWVAATGQDEALARLPPIFGYGWFRLPMLAAHVAGAGPSAHTMVLVLAILAVPLVAGARLSTQAWRWIPLVVSVALFLAAPHQVFGTSFVYQRFAVFLIPGFLIALNPPGGRPVGAPRATRLPVIGCVLALALLASIGVRTWTFNVQARGLSEIVAQIPPGARLLYMPLDNGSSTFWHPVYLHFGTWHQVRNGGVTDFSFASFHMNRYRYRKGTAPNVTAAFSWTPETFEWEQHRGHRFGYFLVRSEDDRRSELFKDAEDRVRLVDRRQTWWLFEQSSSGGDMPIHSERPHEPIER